MDLEIQQYLINCENILRNNHFSNIKDQNNITISKLLEEVEKEEEKFDFLDDFCSQFLKCCNIIQKYLLTERIESTKFNETIFLCLNQILCCIRYLNKLLATEKHMMNSLITNRQYFLDRIFWCLSKLNLMFSSTNDSGNKDEADFLQLIDSVFETIAPHSLITSSFDNKIECNDDCSKKIRKTIDMLLSQILGLVNVSLATDQKPLTALCQKVLRESVNFQEACSLNKGKSKINHHNFQLSASLLESSLYQLEDYLNESLLRLVFDVFIEFPKTCFDELRILIKIDSDDERIDNKIADFDINVDRILQIGIFAMAFAPTSSIKSTVRSCLASLESLDAFLIPSLYCNTDTILEEHFLEEMNKFKLAIHKIIDTNAFVASYIEQLNSFIIELEKKFDKTKLSKVLKMAKLLNEHFKYNESDLKIIPNNKKIFSEFNLMLNECEAVLAYSEQIQISRIIKRLKVFRSCCKKLKEHLNINLKNNTITKHNNREVFIINDNLDLWESYENFATSGISPSVTKIFYENKKNRKNITPSMIANNSKKGIVISTNPLETTPKKIVKRNTSLRTAIFKRQKYSETEKLYENFKENSNSLQITDILDALSNLSSTTTQ